MYFKVQSFYALCMTFSQSNSTKEELQRRVRFQGSVNITIAVETEGTEIEE